MKELWPLEENKYIFYFMVKHCPALSDECFSAIKMGGDFSPELPFKLWKKY